MRIPRRPNGDKNQPATRPTGFTFNWDLPAKPSLPASIRSPTNQKPNDRKTAPGNVSPTVSCEGNSHSCAGDDSSISQQNVTPIRKANKHQLLTGKVDRDSKASGRFSCFPSTVRTLPEPPRKVQSFPPATAPHCRVSTTSITKSLQALTQSVISPSTSSQNTLRLREKVIKTHGCNVEAEEHSKVRIKCQSSADDMVLSRGCRIWGEEDGTLAIAFECTDESDQSHNTTDEDAGEGNSQDKSCSEASNQISEGTQTETTGESSASEYKDVQQSINAMPKKQAPTASIASKKSNNLSHVHTDLEDMGEQTEMSQKTSYHIDDGVEEGVDEAVEMMQQESCDKSIERSASHSYNAVASQKEKTTANPRSIFPFPKASSPATRQIVDISMSCDHTKHQETDKHSIMGACKSSDLSEGVSHAKKNEQAEIEFHDAGHGLSNISQPQIVNVSQKTSTSLSSGKKSSCSSKEQKKADIEVTESTKPPTLGENSETVITEYSNDDSDEEDQPFLTPRPETSYHSMSNASSALLESRALNYQSTNSAEHKQRTLENVTGRKRKISEVEASCSHCTRCAEAKRSRARIISEIKEDLSIKRGEKLKLVSNGGGKKGLTISVSRDELTDSTKPPTMSDFSESEISTSDRELSSLSQSNVQSSCSKQLNSNDFAGPSKMRMRVYKNSSGDPVWELSLQFR